MRFMIRNVTRLLCLATLLAGSTALRSLHELSHADHDGCPSIACSHENGVFHGKNTCNTAHHHDDCDCDHDEHSSPLQSHHCGICDELAAAASDAGLSFVPLVMVHADPPVAWADFGRHCAIESPRVALANPPPSI